MAVTRGLHNLAVGFINGTVVKHSRDSTPGDGMHAKFPMTVTLVGTALENVVLIGSKVVVNPLSNVRKLVEADHPDFGLVAEVIEATEDVLERLSGIIEVTNVVGLGTDPEQESSRFGFFP